MPQAVTGESEIQIRVVCPPGLVSFFKVKFDIFAARFDQWSDGSTGNRAHGYQSFRTSSAQQIQQKGFSSIIARVCQCDLGESVFRAKFTKEPTACLSACDFDVARRKNNFSRE